MPHHKQELDTMLSILNQIKRYYSITQKYVEMSAVRRHISISTEIVSEATAKLNAFEHEKRKYIRYINANNADKNYSSQPHRPSPQTLEKNTASLAQCASDLYQHLNQVHRELIKPSLNSYDIREIVNSVLATTQAFELTLGQLSDYILSKEVVSPAFSLVRHTERLPLLYQQSYEKNYNRNSFFSLGLLYAFKVYCRTSSRIEDIDFLSKKLSLHPLCDDEMRLTAFAVLIRRIADANAQGSILKQLLKKGLDCSTSHVKHYESIFETVNDFCHRNHMFLPENLQCYINKKLQNAVDTGLLI